MNEQQLDAIVVNGEEMDMDDLKRAVAHALEARLLLEVIQRRTGSEELCQAIAEADKMLGPALHLLDEEEIFEIAQLVPESGFSPFPRED